jgi:hypothetical protein
MQRGVLLRMVKGKQRIARMRTPMTSKNLFWVMDFFLVVGFVCVCAYVYTYYDNQAEPVLGDGGFLG